MRRAQAWLGLCIVVGSLGLSQAFLPTTHCATCRRPAGANPDRRRKVCSYPRSHGSITPLSATDADVIMGNDLPLVPLILIVALALGFGAQGWINSLLGGDQGLGAFLQDGRGYSKSGFSPLTADSERAASNDPLPWLKLPKLDYVEVAGQKDEDLVLFEQLEALRRNMNEKLAEGKDLEAAVVRRELEKLMVENGIEFQADE